jgi:hypothetical protein
MKIIQDLLFCPYINISSKHLEQTACLKKNTTKDYTKLTELVC